ncbi:ankyrin repeat-containing domain protein [Hyaloraphidium curvatum]|nr:ankyrin repeat-containing domain protein [Hyaloraphidium curvatum]
MACKRVLMLLLISLVACAAADSAAKAPPPDERAWAAARAGDIPDLGPLLDGADIDAREPGTGQTLLMAAVLAGAAESVKFLLLRGADPAVPEKDGYTPMHGAGFQGRPEVVRILLAHGLDRDDAHADGFTGFHRSLWGALKRHTEAARAFIEAGADVNARAGDGSRPLDMAIEAGNAGTVELLRSHGALSDGGERDEL